MDWMVDTANIIAKETSHPVSPSFIFIMHIVLCAEVECLYYVQKLNVESWTKITVDHVDHPIRPAGGAALSSSA